MERVGSSFFHLATVIVALLIAVPAELKARSGANGSRASEGTILATDPCGSNLLRLVQYRAARESKSNAGEVRNTVVIEADESRQPLWQLEAIDLAGALPSTQWFGDIDCELGAKEVLILIATQVFPDFFLELYRWELPQPLAETSSGMSDVRGMGDVASPEPLLRLSGSLGMLSGAMSGVAMTRMGDRVLAHVDTEVARLYSGRLFLFSLPEDSVSEVKLHRGKTAKARSVGQSALIAPSWVSLPVPWDQISLGEEMLRGEVAENHIPEEPDDGWFACSDLRDCSSALDHCGRITRVRDDARRGFAAWAGTHKELCGREELAAGTCEPLLGCFSGRCGIKFFDETGKQECIP